MPRLVTVRDPVTGTDIPQISLIKFKGEAGNGGFLNFAVDLAIDEAILDEVRLQYKALMQLRENPILSPILFEDGYVKLIALGSESEGPGDDADDEDDDAAGEDKRFVVNINHHSKPALYGTNNAIFSVELDEDGVKLVEASMKGEIMPIGVIYALDFYALRPAFQVKVVADWARVQEHFEENFSANVLFSSVEIGTQVDKLVEDKVIDIQVDTFLPEGEEDGAWIGHRDEALEDFKEMVTQTFFEPSLDPMGPADDGWQDGIAAASQVGLLLASGGIAGAVSFSYKKIDITRIDQKTANLTMNERITVKRSMFPQAHLSGLFRLLRDAAGAVDMTRFVTEVDLEDDWFKRREIIAHPRVDFAAAAVESLNVSLRYGGRTKSLRLTKDSGEQVTSFSSVLDAEGLMEMPVEYDYSVTFSGNNLSERPGQLRSPTRSTSVVNLEIAPQNEGLFFVDRIIAGAASFPWDRYPNVELGFRYRDEANGIDLDDTFLLSKDNTEVTWERFRVDRARDTYEVRKVFHAADGRDRVEEWSETRQDRLLIKNPLSQTRRVTVVPAVAWQLVSMVFAELTYVDEANDIRRTETLFFMNADGQRGPGVFEIALADETRRIVRYSATFLLVDNREIKVPVSETQSDQILLRLDMKGHRMVEVVAPTQDFAAAGVQRIEAELLYEDTENGLSFADRFIFEAPGASRFFEYDYADPNRATYRLKTVEVLANGLKRKRDYGEMIENPLRLRLGS
jgi:hypothetical protein